MLALRGGFWQLRFAVVREIPPAHPPLRIVAVMPARNEADVVGDAVIEHRCAWRCGRSRAKLEECRGPIVDKRRSELPTTA